MNHTEARIAILLLLFATPAASSEHITTRPAATTPPRTLTLEDRVAAQAAVERVLWERRDWPNDSPTAKPPFEAAVRESAIRAKVVDALAKSAALESLLGKPIGAQPDVLAAAQDRDLRVLEAFQPLQGERGRRRIVDVAEEEELAAEVGAPHRYGIEIRVEHFIPLAPRR